VSFDLWRQLTVEHVLGASQGGYLKELRQAVERRFPELLPQDHEKIVLTIDEMNTVTACNFCNSTTSRDRNEKSMVDLLAAEGTPEDVLAEMRLALAHIIESKRTNATWKLASIREAFDRLIAT